MSKRKRTKGSILERLGMGGLKRRSADRKAVQEFEELVRQNPEDHRARIKLAEFYGKQGNLTRAEEEFLTVAKSYKEDGFNLKAIATYKQVLKLSTDNSTIILELAELYRRQGLVRDAVNQYHDAISIFQPKGQRNEVLHVLKKMSELSHHSVDLGLKLADLFAAEGYAREAADQLLQVASIFAEREERQESQDVFRQILSLFTESSEGLRTLQEIYGDRGVPLKAGMVEELSREDPAALESDTDMVVSRLWLIETSDSAVVIEGGEAAPVAEVPSSSAEQAPELASVNLDSGPDLDQDIESFISSWENEQGDDAADPAEGETPAAAPLGQAAAPVPASDASLELGDDALGALFDETDDPFAADDAFAVDAPVAVEEADLGADLGADLDVGVEPAAFVAPPAASPSAEPTAEAISLDDASFAQDSHLEEPGSFSALEGEEEGRIRLKSDRDYLDKSAAQLDPDSITPDNQELFTKSGFDKVFQEFKAGLAQEIGDEDADTHYDLGIAFKEMGLVDDAIHEFEVASRSAEWRVDSLTMIALCHEDQDDLEKALEFLKMGLETEPLTSDQEAGLLYEVGLVHEAMERYDEAYDVFSRVYSLDEEYRNVKKKLADLLKEL